MVYYLCACELLNIYKLTSVLNNYQQRISGIIARDDNLEKSDVKKYQQFASLSSAVQGLYERSVPLPSSDSIASIAYLLAPPSLTRLHFPNLLAHNFSPNHVPL